MYDPARDTRVDAVGDQCVVVVLETLDDVGEGPVCMDHSQRPQGLRADQDSHDWVISSRRGLPSNRNAPEARYTGELRIELYFCGKNKDEMKYSASPTPWAM